MREEAFGWASYWRKLKYKIEKVNGIECIVPIFKAEVESYDPLKINNLPKRPKYPEENDVTPDIALARLDLNNREEIINFVNEFGLLGLWFHPDYCEAKDLEDIGCSTSLNGIKFSNWYRHPKKRGVYAWMEPLSMFSCAASDYKRFLEKIAIAENTDELSSESLLVYYFWKKQLRNVHMAPLLDKKQWVLGWEYQTLLSAIYLKLALNKQAGKSIWKCRKKRCGKFFIADSSGFCSDDCKSAHFKADSINKKHKKELMEEYNGKVEEQLLSDFIDSLFENGISGKR
ncbi:hypothetical protein V7157_20190, partial [Neobacillus drentensis]|uniref:hypothetical protein n=1 Tax=Neobacillus drentensis TaxID=220684 RepID=UPI0030033B19